jgi:RNA polymerase sigma-70 factor, ECF subfamily
MQPESTLDETIMAEVAQGDRASLALLMRRHAGTLLSFVRKMVHDDHRAEEIVQDTFIRIWINRARYQFQRPFKPWMYAIALNQSRALLRKDPHQCLELSDNAALVDEQVSPLELAINDEMASILDHAVDELPVQQRAAVLLRVWEQLSYAEVATALGCSEGTARSHMHHALARLREALERHFAL